MGTQVPPRHPLRQLFGALTEKSFTEHLGWPDLNVTSYVSNLLVDFTHTDQLYKIRNQQDQPVDTVVDLLFESEVLLEAQSMDRERDVHQHIGDFTLFMAGLFPEYLRRLKTAGLIYHKDFLVDYMKTGKRSYGIVAQIADSPSAGGASSVPKTLRQFRALRHWPGVRTVRSGSHERSGVPAGSESSPQLTNSRPLILAHGGAGFRRMTPAQATIWPTRSLSATPSLSRAVPQSSPSNVRSVSWSNPDCSMRDEERIVSWTGCSGWTPRSWKGRSSEAGAVASIEGIVHPITAARLVMEDDGPCFVRRILRPRGLPSTST